MMITVLATAAAAAVCAAVGTGLVRTRAAGWGLLDIPNTRSLHSRVTPRGGGIALVLAVIGGLCVLTVADAVPSAPATAYAGASLMVVAVGWRDDVRHVSPWLRLTVHILAAVAAVAAWGVFDRVRLPYLGDLAWSHPVAVVLTLVWIVGLLNAYNFMDGIDGLAAGQAVVAGVMWTLLLWEGRVPLATFTAALLAAACLGFLWHNWSPARIFMGDAGSGFLGFSFAVVPLMAYDALGDPRLPVAGLLAVAPFVVDTTLTILRRFGAGENLVEAHRTHVYQRLVTGGWSHGAVAGLYLALSSLSCAIALAWWWNATGRWP